jgi:NitT/TauT family transport system permease protein
MNEEGSPVSRLEKWRRIIDPLVLFLLLAVLWEKAVDLFQIKRYLLPPLSQVLESLWSNRALLLAQSLVTTWEIVLGYLWAVTGGVALGLAIFAWPIARRTLYPLIVLFQGLPKIALAPLIVIWFGYGNASKVLMAFLFAFFPVVVATLGGLAGTPTHLVEHFRAIRASRWTTFWRLQALSALPSIMDGCKTAMPLAVIGAIVGEFVGSERGLGHLILEANAQARTDLLFAALVAISIVAGFLYWLVEVIAKRVWWRAL